MIWTKEFWKGLGERAIKTAAQNVAAILVVGVPVFSIDWKAGLGLAATATLGSILTSIGSADFVAGQDELTTK